MRTANDCTFNDLDGPIALGPRSSAPAQIFEFWKAQSGALMGLVFSSQPLTFAQGINALIGHAYEVQDFVLNLGAGPVWSGVRFYLNI